MALWAKMPKSYTDLYAPEKKHNIFTLLMPKYGPKLVAELQSTINMLLSGLQ